MAAKKSVKVKPIKGKKKLATKLEGRTIKKVLNCADNYLRFELDNGEHFEVGAEAMRIPAGTLPLLVVYVCPPGSEPA